MLHIEQTVRELYPECPFGIMLMRGIEDQKPNIGFEKEKRLLEEAIQEKFAEMERNQIRDLSPFSHYYSYYKKFKKTYHVLAQCESIAKGKKKLPNGPLIVQAMFMAEIKNQLLTAGYDLKNLKSPFIVDLADGKKNFYGIGKQERNPPVNDIIFSDSNSILGSIICGPDHNNRIQDSTSEALFAIYGVPGITKQQMEQHFIDIQTYVTLFSPAAEIKSQEIL